MRRLVSVVLGRRALAAGSHAIRSHRTELAPSQQAPSNIEWMSGDTCTTRASLQSAVAQGGFAFVHGDAMREILAPHGSLSDWDAVCGELERSRGRYLHGRRRPISPPAPRGLRRRRHRPDSSRVPSTALSGARLQPAQRRHRPLVHTRLRRRWETVPRCGRFSRSSDRSSATWPRRRAPGASRSTSSGSRPGRARKGSRHRRVCIATASTTCSCC